MTYVFIVLAWRRKTKIKLKLTSMSIAKCTCYLSDRPEIFYVLVLLFNISDTVGLWRIKNVVTVAGF